MRNSENYKVILQRFWDAPERTEELRQCYGEIVASDKKRNDSWMSGQIKFFIDIMTSNGRVFGFKRSQFCSSYKTLGRFREEPNGKALSSYLHKTGLLIAMDKLYQDWPEEIQSKLKPLPNLAKAMFDETALLSRKPKNASKELSDEGVLPDVIQALKFVSRMLHTDLNELEKAQRQFLKRKPEPHENISRYVSYRYDVKGGYVTKSFTRFHRPGNGIPICTFDNYYKDGPQDRECHGIVVPTKQVTYLIGQVDDGTALKVMAFPPSNRYKAFQEGMMLSFLNNVVSAKICMVATDVEQHTDAGIGRFSIDTLGDELSQYSDSIRNKIEFVVERDIIDEDDNILNQSEMVDMVGRLISSNSSSTPLLRYADTKEVFNPAKTDEYTFNAALEMKN